MNYQNTVLISGASGLIGSHLCKILLPSYKVIGLSRQRPLSSQNWQNYTHLEMDLSRPFVWPKEMSKPDMIVHLAQSEFYKNFPEKSEELFSVNVMSTLKLLNWAKEIGVKNFVLASSGGIYGFGNRFKEEDDAQKKLNFYLNSKLTAELISDNFKEFFNLQILRFFFVYGPTQKKQMLLPRLIQNVINGEPIQLQGQNGISLNPIFVSDAVEAIAATLKLTESHKFNIAGSEILSLREIGEFIGQKVKKKVLFKLIEGDAHDLIGDIEKMKSLLHTPKVSLQEGLSLYLQSER
jgi:UDP-glucose 4-epimerase